MGWFSSTKNLDSLEDLLLEQLQDLYDAEHQLTKALPQMAEAAHCPDLKSAFSSHLSETQGHVKRLEQVFRELGKEAKRETCPAMEGLIEEGEEMLNSQGDHDVKDAALIAAAQRVEHYEMAGYGTVRTLAQQLGHTSAVQLLQDTLDEEKAADEKLTAIAEQMVNPRAA